METDWLFVGEAPGSEEDKQGVPFVGRAGPVSYTHLTLPTKA